MDARQPLGEGLHTSFAPYPRLEKGDMGVVLLQLSDGLKQRRTHQPQEGHDKLHLVGGAGGRSYGSVAWLLPDRAQR